MQQSHRNSDALNRPSKPPTQPGAGCHDDGCLRRHVDAARHADGDDVMPIRMRRPDNRPDRQQALETRRLTRRRQEIPCCALRAGNPKPHLMRIHPITLNPKECA